MSDPASALLVLDIRRLDDRTPTRDLALHQRRQLLWSPLRLVRNITTKVEKALTHALIIQRNIERARKLVEDRLRRAFWSKQTIPRDHLKLRQPRFDRGRCVG